MSTRILLLAVFLLAAPAAVLASGVFVNGVELRDDVVSRLKHAYSTNVPAGRYWYDRRSGLWGLEGGPGIGRIEAGLALGGPLQPGASASRTGVFVNGREIHGSELAWLESHFGPVRRGRYWLDAVGRAGFEGGPAQFDLSGHRPGYNRDTPGGGLMSDGACHGYLHPDGASVVTGDC